MSAEETVVIAGGGPIGMALSIDLALRGIPSVVLEQRASEATFPPRTNQTTARSMEHFRRWGIAQALRDNDAMDQEYTRDFRWITRLNGYVVANFPGGVEWAPRFDWASEIPEWAPNPSIEKTLRERVDELGVDIRFSCIVKGFEADDDHVTVSYTDINGDEQSVSGAFLVGADGSRSVVRNQLGVRMEGHADLAIASVWYIHAPAIKELARDKVGLSAFYWFCNEDRTGQLLIVQDAEGHYLLFDAPIPEGVDPNDWEREKAQLIENVGEEIEVTVQGGGEVRIHSLMAPRFDHGRVILAGDAAHLISPFGGFGMNIGIEDVANLGWKLAAMLQGWGGDKLISSYSTERREAETWLLDECAQNVGALAPHFAQDGMEADDEAGEALRKEIGETIVSRKSREYISMGGQFGYQYSESPVVARNGASAPISTLHEYKPSSVPGCRAPHVWVDDDTSLFDLFGPYFTLLKLDASIDTSALEVAAVERGVPLTVIAPQHPKLDELYQTKLALIRPDEHVAWRSDATPDDPGAIIDLARGV